jgi:hypothetical protein
MLSRLYRKVKTFRSDLLTSSDDGSQMVGVAEGSVDDGGDDSRSNSGSQMVNPDEGPTNNDRDRFPGDTESQLINLVDDPSNEDTLTMDDDAFIDYMQSAASFHRDVDLHRLLSLLIGRSQQNKKEGLQILKVPALVQNIKGRARCMPDNE